MNLETDRDHSNSHSTDCIPFVLLKSYFRFGLLVVSGVQFIT